MVNANIGLRILAMRNKIRTRIPIFKIPKIICNSIRFCEFLSTFSPSCITNVSDDLMMSEAIESNSFFIPNWLIIIALPP